MDIKVSRVFYTKGVRDVRTCKKCSQEFKNAAALTRHRISHHSIEMECFLCSEKVQGKDAIRQHMKINHELGQVYRCNCCNWTFRYKYELMGHQKMMNEMKVPGKWQPIAKTYDRPTVSSTDPPKDVADKTPSLSPSPSPSSVSISTATSSTSSVAASSSPSPIDKPIDNAIIPETTPQAALLPAQDAAQTDEPIPEIMNKAVEAILNGKIFTGEQLTQPATWVHIWQTALTIVEAWHARVEAEKQSGKREEESTAKRQKLE